MIEPLFYWHKISRISSTTDNLRDLKNLDIFNASLRASFTVYTDPLSNDTLNLRRIHLSQGQVVSRVEDNDITASMDGLARKHWVGGSGSIRNRSRQHRSKVIDK